MDTCNRVRAIIEEAYRDAPRENAEQWIQWCDHYIQLYTRVLTSVPLSTGEKNKLQSTISSIQTWREKFVDRQRGGGGLQDAAAAAAAPRGRILERVRWRDAQSAFQGRIRTGTVINLQHRDLESFFRDAKTLASTELENTRTEVGNIKANTILAGKFRVVKNDETVIETKHFNTRNEIILPATNIKKWFDDHVTDPLLRKVENFEEKDSGWLLVEILNLMVNINRYEPHSGSGLSTYIELPYFIQSRKAVINIQNSDEYCFLWAIIAALHPAEINRCRTISYPHYSDACIPNTNQKLNYEGISFPLALKDVAKFEKMNGLCINVYGIETNDYGETYIVPYHLTRAESEIPTIHLLLYCSNVYLTSYEQPIYHFAWIHDLSRLLSSQVSLHKTKKFFCDRCLCHFQEETSYERHRLDCFLVNKCRMLLPEKEEDKILAFKNYKFKESVPFVIYADLECLLQHTDDEKLCQQHIAHSAAFYLKCSFDDNLSKFEMQRGPDCVEWFIRRLEEIGQMVHKILKTVVPMEKLTSKQWKEFHAAKVCHICEKPFTATDIKHKKHRDHCHFTGKYRGPAHRSCNLNYQDSHDTPVVFHNLSSDDAHFFIKDLAKDFKGAVNLLPINKERYIAFTKHTKY